MKKNAQDMILIKKKKYPKMMVTSIKKIVTSTKKKD